MRLRQTGYPQASGKTSTPAAASIHKKKVSVSWNPQGFNSSRGEGPPSVAKKAFGSVVSHFRLSKALLGGAVVTLYERSQSMIEASIIIVYPQNLPFARGPCQAK